MKYDEDLYQWTIEQGRALRDRATNALDYDHLAEEIESLGRSDKREIASRLENLLVHLLKWRCQPEWRSPSLEASIDEARRRIERILRDSPSLRSYPGEVLDEAYGFAIRNKAIRALELIHLPEACPWSIEEVLDKEFLPK
ncbi:MAG: DUF29 domain-containing protein [Candidatus Eremiobacteraeota bacterium]|nr:DUF29 domain-containing protein [Candidatus Eremiobacteraeota bacterium]